jgi:hypothetical protein
MKNGYKYNGIENFHLILQLKKRTSIVHGLNERADHLTYKYKIMFTCLYFTTIVDTLNS